MDQPKLGACATAGQPKTKATARIVVFHDSPVSDLIALFLEQRICPKPFVIKSSAFLRAQCRGPGQCAKFWQPGALMKKEFPELFERTEELDFAAHVSLRVNSKISTTKELRFEVHVSAACAAAPFFRIDRGRTAKRLPRSVMKTRILLMCICSNLLLRTYCERR